MSSPCVVVLCGRPGRGQASSAEEGSRYPWLWSVKARGCNVGNYRRQIAGAELPHQFFDATNAEAYKLRKQAATAALDDMIKWIKEDGGQVAFYDATNSTKDRRQMVVQYCKDHGIAVIGHLKML